MRLFLENLVSRSTLSGLVICAGFISWLYWEASSLGSSEIALLFSGLTALLSITAGFIGAFYFFMAARSTSFLEQIRESKSFREIIRLTRHAFLTSLIAIGLCLRNMIFTPPLASPIGVEDVLPGLSVLFMAYVFGTFWRCMQLFRSLAE